MPLQFIIETTLSATIYKIFLVFVIVAVFVCTIANQALTSRIIFSLCRDGKFPFASALQRVPQSTRVPVAATVLVAVLSGVIILNTDGIAIIAVACLSAPVLRLPDGCLAGCLPAPHGPVEAEWLVARSLGDSGLPRCDDPRHRAADQHCLAARRGRLVQQMVGGRLHRRVLARRRDLLPDQRACQPRADRPASAARRGVRRGRRACAGAKSRTRRSRGEGLTAPPDQVSLPAEFLARPQTVAHSVARVLAERGLQRVYGLPGGHTKAIWDELDRAGVRIVSTRHECAAVHMAQAEAELGGDLAVAIVTAGPGLTNAVTGIACAELAASLCSCSRPCRPGPRPGWERWRRSTRPPSSPRWRASRARWPTRATPWPRSTSPSPQRSASRARRARHTLTSPPTSCARRRRRPMRGTAAYRPRRRALRPPDPAAVDEAAALIRASRRPLVIAGRAVRPEAELLRAFLERSGALCLDTRESKGAVPDDAPGFVPAVRGRAIAEADLVITLARNLDFEVAYGSAAIFRPGVRFLRVGRTFDELARNRRGTSELCADMSAALAALVEAEAAPSDPDRAWRDRLLAENAAKAEGLDERLAREADGAEGGMHPYSLLRRLNRYIGPDTVVVADGGDVLAFARVALRAPTYLDLGPFGCLGVGVPFANAAALARPDARVIAVIGDGAFGFNAIEVETAVREGAEVLLVVVDDAAWNIERQDQIDHYDEQGRSEPSSPAPPTLRSPSRSGRTGDG